MQDADHSFSTRSTLSRAAPIVGAALLVTAVWVVLSPDYGVTWDERSRHAYGVKVLRFVRGEIPRTAFVPTATGAHLYAALFDTTAARLHEWTGGDVWTVRHRLNAVAGGVGLLATGLLALRLFGPSAGFLAVLLLALSPRYMGDAMNNPKDVPFAACCAVVLLSFTLVRRTFPFLSWGRASVVGLALALAFNVRPGALLFVAFLWLLAGVLTISTRAWSCRQVLHTGGLVAVATVIALVLGTALWPWAQANPFLRPVQALIEASQFGWHGTMLFFGQDVPASRPPFSYVPVWMALTIPPVVIAGIAFAAWTTLRDGSARATCLALWAVVLLPIALVTLRRSTLYAGWRHLLFVYPPLVVLAAAGWASALAAERSRSTARFAVMAVLLAGLIEPLVFIVRNHPHEIVYFNALAGGPRGALGRFELDYWANSFHQAGEWCDDLARAIGMPLVVAGRPPCVMLAELSRHKALRVRPYEARQHHLELRILRGSREDVEATLMRHDALHVVRTHDGTPLAMVFRGPRFDEVATRVEPFFSPRERVLLEDR